MIALPCNVQDAVIGAFFILLGFRGKDFVFSYLQRQNEHKFEKNLAYLMGYVLIYFCVKKWLPYQWFDLGSNIYNVLSLISSLLGFCILFQLAIIIEKTYVFLEFFRRYGKDSMYILLLHHADILMLRDWTQRSFEFAFATVAGYGFMVYLYDRIRFVIETKSMQKAEHS